MILQWMEPPLYKGTGGERGEGFEISPRRGLAQNFLITIEGLIK